MVLKCIAFFLLAMATMAAPTDNAGDAKAACNCSFHARLSDDCHYGGAHNFVFAAIPWIITPSGNKSMTGVDRSATGPRIEDPNVWYIKVDNDDDCVSKVLSVTYKNGLVTYGLDYSGRGGTPKYTWTENDNNVPLNEYGCSVTRHWSKGGTQCEPERLVNVRVSATFLDRFESPH